MVLQRLPLQVFQVLYCRSGYPLLGVADLVPCLQWTQYTSAEMLSFARNLREKAKHCY